MHFFLICILAIRVFLAFPMRSLEGIPGTRKKITGGLLFSKVENLLGLMLGLGLGLGLG